MSQSLKSYPKYKDSGIQWIGKIPEGWEVRRIKFIAQVYSGTDGKNDEGNFPLYGANGIIGKCERPTFKRDKVIIGRVGSSGEINYAQGYYCVSDNALVVDNKGNILPRYLFYFLSTIDFSVDVTLNAQPLLTATNVKNKLLFLPPLPDQTTIANFLDKKTAKIDALIEKDKKLIELLKEKRTALINHAVTKGLDPNVKLKDSGVKWIGKIPEGWEVHKLKYKSYINKKKLEDNTNPNFKMNYLDISNVDSNGNIMKIEEQYFEDAPSRARRIPKTHDTIISTVRTYLKAIAYLDNIPENLIVSTGFAVIEPTKNIKPKFLFYAIRSEKFIQKVIADSKGVAYPAINAPELGQIYLIVPPLQDQTEIANYLDKATSKIDKTIQKIEKKIELLEEYKKSLIHHVVTGKVDVRGVVT